MDINTQLLHTNSEASDLGIEVWLPTEYRDYSVSNLGNVRSYKRDPNGLLMRCRLFRNEYLVINLQVDGLKETKRLHRLVLCTFTGQPYNHPPLVRHLDGDPTNNRLCNLDFGTPKDNRDDAVRHGTAVTPVAHHVPESLKLIAMQLREQGKSLREIAAAIGCHHSTVGLWFQKKPQGA